MWGLFESREPMESVGDSRSIPGILEVIPGILGIPWIPGILVCWILQEGNQTPTVSPPETPSPGPLEACIYVMGAHMHNAPSSGDMACCHIVMGG